ncbi:MAG: hypothetical protein K5694_00375 [Bacilli bacterium]|nr:hypothetical protein [Bacilli bacterium]
MRPDEKKPEKKPRKNPYRTGEDIDMLHEREYEPQSNDRSGNYRYKDHYDGA